MRFGILSALLVCMLGSGCSTTANAWGGSTTFTPGWQTLNESLIRAGKNPHTWVPLIVAAAFSVDDFDQQTVDWASRHNPLFGSIDDAADASSLMLDVSRVNYLVTALATPSGKGKELVVNKIRGIAFGMEAIKVSGRITKKLKAISKRPRPDNENAANSFPSGHTSNAATIASLAARNIERISLTEPQEKAWRYSSYSVAALTGWARVEARRHYPSDILAGYALGNFLGNFLNDAFITPKNRDRVNLSLNLDKENGSTLMLVYHW